ncbi:hypothetical protein [Citricoccus sp. NR2]|uniref:hypothetical protein n=1 Tax=Citricoccus sp. NR2 TaxID=3004095 RepID=UPI0022DD451F|nr:hypothetical protein [Citricoccus sp. NR2]WBL18469.1 hypothetical protein O1A05_11975 [Citricoccus sp. NR2]
MRTRTTLTALTVSALLLAGCGGEVDPEPTSTPTENPVVQEAEPTSLEYELWWEPEDGSDAMPINGQYQITGIVPGINEAGVLIPSVHDDPPLTQVGLLDSGATSRLYVTTLDQIDGVLACEITNYDTGEVVDTQKSEPGPEQQAVCEVTAE